MLDSSKSRLTKYLINIMFLYPTVGAGFPDGEGELTSRRDRRKV